MESRQANIIYNFPISMTVMVIVIDPIKLKNKTDEVAARWVVRKGVGRLTLTNDFGESYVKGSDVLHQPTTSVGRTRVVGSLTLTNDFGRSYVRGSDVLH